MRDANQIVKNVEVHLFANMGEEEHIVKNVVDLHYANLHGVRNLA
jgi:hypothetical protein